MFDHAAAVDTLTRAFFDDPGYGYAFPVVESRKRKLHWAFDIKLRLARHRNCQMLSDPQQRGLLVWWKPDQAPHATLWEEIRFGVLTSPFVLGLSTVMRVLPMDRALLSRHQLVLEMGPHAYIELFAVDPAAQGAGVGSRLMRQALAHIDAASVPAYLFTSNEVNVPMYERYGFRVVNDEPLDGTGPRAWLMRRDVAGRVS
jgi:ribosomal protein S18 acetylase RimI-like enzyme